MTVQRKLIVGLEDIQAITFECMHCLSRLTVSPERAGAIPDTCPRCHQEWSVIDPATGQHGPAMNFVALIRRLRSLAKEPGNPQGFRILLEVEEPKP